MTKIEARERNKDWQKALAEGRVVRMNGGLTLRSYITVEAAKAAVTQITTAGLNAEIVRTDR
jgi:hypothetical protein